MKPTAFLRSFLFLASSSLLAIPSAHAQLYWDDNSTAGGAGATPTGTWGTDLNWNTDPTGAAGALQVLTSNTDDLYIVAGPSSTSGSGNTVITVSGTQVADSLNFQHSGGFTLSGGTSITLGNGTAGSGGITMGQFAYGSTAQGAVTITTALALNNSQTWTNNSSNLLLLNNGTAAVISGSSALAVNGTGRISILGSATGFSGNVTVSGGGELEARTNVTNLAGSFGTGNLEINGGTVGLYYGNTLNRALGSGAGQIQITGGVSGFSGNGSSGSTVTITGGPLLWGSASFNPTELVLQNSKANTNGKGTLAAAIDLNGTDRTIRSDQTGGLTAGGTGTFSGNITNGSGTAAGLIKTGIGEHVLSGTNTYDGGTSVNQGTLTVANTSALPGFATPGEVTVAGGAVLGVRTGGWTAAQIDTLRGAVTWGALNSQLGLDTTAGNFSYASDITGILSVTKYGANALTLGGNSTYTGTTTIYGGTNGALVADSSNALGSGGDITFKGGTLRFTANTTSTTWGTRIKNSTSAITLDSNGQSISLAGNIDNTNTVGLTKTGTGSLALSGTNTYTGSTTLSGGTLVVVGTSALGSGAINFQTTGTTLHFQQDSNMAVTNVLTTNGRNLNRTIVVDRVTPGAAVNLAFSSAPNLDVNNVLNFQKGANITSGTPTITFTSGTGSSDSNHGTLNGGTNAGPVTFNPTDVNVVVNGITSSGRTRGYIFQGNTDGNRLTGIFQNGSGTSIRKDGIGTWTFAGTSQYLGTTEVANGTLKFEKLTALYNSTAANWTAANINVKSGGTLAFNVGGTGEFSSGNVTTLLTNLAASSSPTNGMNAGSRFAFDTTNASGGSFTISDVIADTTGASGGNRGLTKLGTGTLVLTNTNTYTGATTVSAGVLAVDGALANTTTTVGNTATLQGIGTVGGSVTIQNGGTLAAGNSIESLGVGALSLEGGSTFAYELDTSLYAGTPGLAGDLTYSTGTLDIATGSLLALTDYTSTVLALNSKLTLISYFGGWASTELFTYDNATLVDGATFTLGLNQWRFDYDDTTGGVNYSLDQAGASRFVTMTVIPEPRAALLGGIGLLLLLRRKRA